MKIFLTLICSLLFLASGQAAQEKFSTEHKFIFHAILEGAYSEGLKDDEVSAVMGHQIYDNFIYGCPICMPVYHAFQVYEKRPVFAGDKDGDNNFGKGLPIQDRKELLGDAETRRIALKRIISRWVEQKISSTKLTLKEERQLRANIKEMEQKGGKWLVQLQNDWKEGKKQIAAVELALRKAKFENATIHAATSSLEESYLGRHYEGWEFCPSCNGSILKNPKKDKT